MREFKNLCSRTTKSLQIPTMETLNLSPLRIEISLCLCRLDLVQRIRYYYCRTRLKKSNIIHMVQNANRDLRITITKTKNVYFVYFNYDDFNFKFSVPVRTSNQPNQPTNQLTF